ncbi:hypothetical protein LUX33_00360 [Actinomadura madurae]|nr:hypothetical protein [Actinomadura madurae]MCP9947062.1 hypothetical protein [Actinomadura madurae]MCP9963828.1 hypothetical protein [Actinomadura madurae]MCP9976303.1 hypothetical protein [Actinomadura madurae]
MQELQLAVRRHHQQPVGLGDAAGDLGEELGAGDPHRDRQPDLLGDLPPQPPRDVGGRRRSPSTSRNASSMDSPSTSGVVARNTANTAVLASL